MARDAGPHSADSVQRLFELSADMLGTATLDGYFTRLNPAWERILGWTREQLMAEPFISFVHPDDVEATLARSADPRGPGQGRGHRVREPLSHERRRLPVSPVDFDCGGRRPVLRRQGRDRPQGHRARARRGCRNDAGHHRQRVGGALRDRGRRVDPLRERNRVGPARVRGRRAPRPAGSLHAAPHPCGRTAVPGRRLPAAGRAQDGNFVQHRRGLLLAQGRLEAAGGLLLVARSARDQRRNGCPVPRHHSRTRRDEGQARRGAGGPQLRGDAPHPDREPPRHQRLPPRSGPSHPDRRRRGDQAPSVPG